MNNEIKEILLKDFNEILVKEFCTDWKEKRLYIELLVNSTPFSNLLDYITNLQEENEKLKKENIKLYKKDTKIINKLKEELKITQEKWNKDKQFSECRTMEMLDYKSRNEKAIEYIKDNLYYLVDNDDKNLLNILNGGDDNE